MRRFVAVWLLLAGIAVPGFAFGLTLEEALRAAISNHPAIQGVQAQEEAARAVVGQARSEWLPHLTLHEQYTRTDEPAGSLFIALNQERNVMADPAYDLVDPAIADDFETRLQIDQTVYDPKVDFGLRQAQKAAEVTTANATWRAELAAFGAYRAYLEVQHAEAALTWVESSRRESAEIARVAGEHRRAGTGLKADELRANVQLAEAKRRELTARNDLTLARRRLALAVGRPGGEAEISTPVDEGSIPAFAPQMDTSARADLKAQGLQVDAFNLEVKKSHAEWLPRLGLAAHYAWHDQDNPFGSDSESWLIGAGLHWELFDGLRRSATTAKAMAEQRAGEARLVDARREQEFKLGEASLRAEEAKLQRDSARESALAADESRRLLQQRFEAGLADLADLLAAQSALDRARFDVAAAENRLLLALGTIHFEAGRFLQNFLPAEESPR